MKEKPSQQYQNINFRNYFNRRVKSPKGKFYLNKSLINREIYDVDDEKTV